MRRRRGQIIVGLGAILAVGLPISARADAMTSPLACHEIGHTVGLLDGEASVYGPNSVSTFANRSCMRSSPNHDYYSTHNKGHINGKY